MTTHEPSRLNDTKLCNKWVGVSVVACALLAVCFMSINEAISEESRIASLVTGWGATLLNQLPEHWALFLLLVVLCLLVEACFLGFKHSSIKRLIRPSHSAKADLVLASLSLIGLGGLLAAFFTLGTSYFLPKLLTPVFDFNLLHRLSSPVLQFILWFIVIDILDYWHHRLLHAVPFLWEIHLYHHSATEFNIITGNRVHPFERGSRILFICIPALILGTPIVVYLAVKLIKRVIDLFQHSMLNWDYGWMGRWLIYSPIGHRIHHSALPEHWDKNFGNLCPLWDHIFGTWYSGQRVNQVVDVANNPYNKAGIACELIACCCSSLRKLIKALRLPQRAH